MLISSDGTIIRLRVSDISILGRATQGVTLMRTSNGNNVVSIARIETEGDENPEDEQDDATVENQADPGADGETQDEDQ